MRKVLSIFIFFYILTAVCVYSQSKFNLNIYGGYTLPMTDLQGDFPDTSSSVILDFRKSSTMLTTSGFNIGATGKYAVDTLGKARITASLNYNSFTGSKDYSLVNGARTYKNKVNIFTISAGVEYGFFPKKKVNPFAGLDLAANFYSGKIDVSGDTARTITRKGESRFGVIVTAGADIKLSSNIGIVAGVKYALTNLIGKKTETITTLNPIVDIEEETSGASNEIPLNDEETASNKSKALYYLQFFAGISINFGVVLK